MGEYMNAEALQHITQTFARLQPGEGMVLVRADADEEHGAFTILMQELPAGLARSVIGAARAIMKGTVNN